MPALPSLGIKSIKMAYIPRKKDPHQSVFKKEQTTSKKIRNSYKWKKIASRVQMLQPVCFCLKISKHTDHIIPLSKNGAAFNFRNLWALCEKHSMEKTEWEKINEIPYTYDTRFDKIPSISREEIVRIVFRCENKNLFL